MDETVVGDEVFEGPAKTAGDMPLDGSELRDDLRRLSAQVRPMA